MAFGGRRKTFYRILTIVKVAVFLAGCAWVARDYLADRLAQEPNVRNFELAIRVDPSNADIHLRLGRLFQYALTDISPDRAVEELRTATELNPLDPQPWLDLGAAMEFQGKIGDAEACLRRADSLAPHLPPFQWAIGNFFLLHGNVDEAFRHFRVVLAGSSEYNRILFNTAWKASGDAARILNDLIPHNLECEIDYLYFLVSNNRFAEAQPVWKRIMNHRGTFPPAWAATYIDRLIDAHRTEEAFQVWNDVRTHAMNKPARDATSQNLLANGDFEEDLVNVGFDWRIAPLEDVYAGLDQSVFHSPGRALLIQFAGKNNVFYRNVYQHVRVKPGHTYRLRGYMKAEGITTDSGPCLEVRDAYDAARLDQLTQGLTGTTTGWTELMLDFTPASNTDLVIVSVTRLASRKLDNLIVGKVWLDDLTFVELSAGSALRRPHP